MSNLPISSDAVTAVTDWVVHKLGYPLVTVELTNKQLEYAFNEAVEQFSYYITEWSMRNNLSNALGLTRETDFTRIFVAQDFNFTLELAKAYSVQAGVGGDIPVRRDFFVLSGGVQHYYLPNDRLVTDVMWVEPIAIDRYIVDPYSNPYWATTEFGFAYMGNNLSYIVPVYWSLYHAQNFELRTRIRKGDYSYTLMPWSGGTNHVTLTPVPTDRDTGKGVWYFYWDVEDFNKYSGQTPGDLVSNPSDIRFDEIPYTAMNSWAKFWIKRYTLATAKEILSRIRGKFSTLQIPDAEVQMDADELASEAKDEKNELVTELQAELDKLDYNSLIEASAVDAENLNRQLSFNPGGIYLG